MIQIWSRIIYLLSPIEQNTGLLIPFFHLRNTISNPSLVDIVIGSTTRPLNHLNSID